MALTNAEKQRRWKARNPEKYRAKLAAARAKRGLSGGHRYRSGKRGQWGVVVLHDAAGEPLVAVAAHVGTERLLGYEARRFVSGISRRLACRLATAENCGHLRKRLHHLPGCEGIGGIWGLARRIAAGTV